jgi:endoglucanase Acf2
MRASCVFHVDELTPVDWTPPVSTGVDVGHAHMVKRYEGAVNGTSVTQFSAAYDQASGTGTYVAMESFEGTVDGRAGAFNFAHSATTTGGPERLAELFVIVPASGAGELAGITGSGALEVDAEGVRRLHLDYELP